ncbi:MAG: phosphomannomutase/phosphoglucomutase [Cellvibrionaceae bacterium]|nr:phosphomannomutase/phosphoglucomutase [Cellvibrionaceae bacterium]
MAANEASNTATAKTGNRPRPVVGTVKNNDILDIEITEQDEALFGFEDHSEQGAQGGTQPTNAEEYAEDEANSQGSNLDVSQTIPDVVFRAYDIRGIAGSQVSNELAYKVGQSVASEALDDGENTLIIARDARLSSPELTEYLIRGVLSTGCDVLNIGTVPTPLMYFATEVLDTCSSGIIVTASHNPADHNGFKIVINGKCRSEEDIKAIRGRILKGEIYRGTGTEHRHDIVPQYIDTIFSDVALAGEISIVVDAANAVAGTVAPQLFEELGCQVTPLYCDLDGSFPNHSPDPSVEANLQDLIKAVQDAGADMGVAFDGDGDRLAVVTPKGKIIWPDRLLMLYARDIVSRNPGADVVFDVKSTRHLNKCITEVGGRPVMWKTGHSPMKAKMQETGALLGGEFSGHIFIKDRWYGFDDGLYAAARLIEIVSLQGQSLDDLCEELPQSVATPEIRVPVSEDKKFALIESLRASGNFADAKITCIDGLRADFSKGWGLVRASNTSAAITLRFEADTPDFLHKLKALFVREIRKIDNTINIDWK